MTSAPAPVSAVPRRMRLVLALVAAVVVGGMVVVGLLLKSSSTGVVTYQTSDQVGMIALGLLLGAGILALGRSRVDADARGIRVLNVVVRHDLPWSSVREVRFGRKSLWASLLLENDEEIALLAVQITDRERAAVAIEGLRALHAAARTSGERPRE